MPVILLFSKVTHRFLETLANPVPGASVVVVLSGAAPTIVVLVPPADALTVVVVGLAVVVVGATVVTVPITGVVPPVTVVLVTGGSSTATRPSPPRVELKKSPVSSMFLNKTTASLPSTARLRSCALSNSAGAVGLVVDPRVLHWSWGPSQDRRHP